MVKKSATAFRTIGEAAEELELPQHVLRFWESQFSQIRPMKRSGGRRFYRPNDLDLVAGIKELLHGQGHSIKEAKQILRSEGVKYVSSLGRGDKAPVIHPQEPPKALHSTAFDFSKIKILYERALTIRDNLIAEDMMDRL